MLKKPTSHFFTLTLFTLFFGFQGSVSAQNLLINSGFENGIDSWNSINSTIASSSTSLTGKSSIVTTDLKTSWAGPGQEITDALNAEGKGEYELEAYLKLASGSTNGKIVISINDDTGINYHSVSGSVNASDFNRVNGNVTLNWTGTLYSARLHIETGRETSTDFFVDDVSISLRQPERPSNEPQSNLTVFYSYQSDFSNPQPLDNASLQPGQTYFRIKDKGQYKRVSFYCCKGLSGNATGEPHAPAITVTSTPYGFSRNTAGMTSGIRELYFDTFPTTGGVENHSVNFTVVTPSKNSSPTISGSPNHKANEGKPYQFQPIATDVDNDMLSFNISGQPGWAIFDSNTGRLSGVPTQDDTGTYKNIIISVTDGTETVRLSAFNIQVESISSTERSSNAQPSNAIVYYSYQSDFSNPQPLEGAILLPKQTFFFIKDNQQYKKVNFYCCKGISDGATGEPHSPAFTDTTAPYSFIRNTASMTAGIRELYFDTFPTEGGVENHAVYFTLATQNKNAAPIIFGSPTNSVNRGNHYDFLPGTNDADNDTLTFSISGQPNWTIFDSNSGRLSGTPTQSNIATYNNIIISVTDGINVTNLPSFSIKVEATAPNEELPDSTVFYYQSNLSNPKPLEGATLQPGPANFFIEDNGLYNAVTFYCCKELSGNAAGEPHEPAKINTSAPYSITLDTTAMTSGTREFYYDIFPAAGGIESHRATFSVAVNSNQTGDLTIKWAAPSAREDGSSLSLSEIAGFTLHYGLASKNYTKHIKVNDHTAVSTAVKNITVGKYFVALTTRDTSGRESTLSNEIEVTVK